MTIAGVTARSIRTLGSAALILLGGTHVHAQSQGSAPASRPAAYAEVGVIDEPIEIDGQLDEAAWQSAPRIDDLVQRQPNPGTVPSERTEVRLLRDRDNLYIAVIAFDSEPAEILGIRALHVLGLRELLNEILPGRGIDLHLIERLHRELASNRARARRAP